MTYATHRTTIVPMMNFGLLTNAGIACDPPDGAMRKSLAAEMAIVNAVGRSANDALAGVIAARGLEQWRRVIA
jgi:hypothetical protein